MRFYRFIHECDLAQPELVIRDHALAHQIKNVFRLGIGQSVNLCDGKGNEARVQILVLSSHETKVKIMELFNPEQTDLKKVYLYCSILKRENFEIVVQKSTEVGVAGIIPIITKRTIKSGLKIERLQKIAKEASEQCGRRRVPEICQAIDIKQAFAQAQGRKIFLQLGQAGKTENNLSDTISVFVGPEGGWDSSDVEQMPQGYEVLSLGKLVLRAETAAVVASYLAVNGLF